MERKIGIIDLGSNTSRLVILAYTPGESFRLLDEVRERVRLSEGMGAENILRPEPIERTIHLLKVFRSLCEANGIDTIMAVATSAVRDARNQAEFLQRVRAEAGLDLRVLSGPEEAYYGYLGAINSLSTSSGHIVDIGGGSLQIARVVNRQLRQSTSLPLGAVRLTEMFMRRDPIDAADVQVLRRYIDALLSSLNWLEADQSDQLIGMGGTLRALAKIDQRRRDYPLDLLHGYVLSLTSVEAILHDLQALPLRKREKYPGLNSDRADVIVAGTIALTRVMRDAGYDEIVVCGQGIREGLFYEQFLRESQVQLVPEVRAFGLANLSYRYDLNWVHARHVEKLALALFDQLRSLHGYGPTERAILRGAAVLHDVGVAIGFYNHDLHSAYLILNADLPGFTHHEIAMMALLARHHRRGSPEVGAYQGVLTQADEDRAEKLSLLLRLAEYLERGRTQVVQSIKCRVQGPAVHLTMHVSGDASTEEWSVNRLREVFRRTFKRDLVVQVQTVVPGKKARRVAQAASPSLWARVEEFLEQ